MKVRARHLVFGVCLSTVVMAAAASSWACTMFAVVQAPTPSEGKAGTSVVVTGEKFLTSVPVAVFFKSWTDNNETKVWDGTTTGNGGFTAKFTISGDLAPGRYGVIGRVDGFQAAAENSFHVLPSSPPETKQPLPPTGPPETQTGAGAPSTPDGGAGSEPVVSSEPQQATGGSSTGGSGTGPIAASGSGRTPPPPARPSAPAGSTSGGATPAGGPAAISEPAAAPVTGDDATPAPLPSPRSATDELWSGFSEGPRRAIGGTSLTDPAPASSGGGMTAGLALLGMGLVGLASGLGVVSVRRRRVPANTP